MRPYITKGPDGSAAFTPPNSDNVQNLFFTIAAAKTVTWPTNANRFNMSGTADYWTRTGGTAAAPSADVTDGTGSALNVGQRSKGAGETTFSVYSAGTNLVSIEFWTDELPTE